MNGDTSEKQDASVETVVNSSITISALLSGFVLVFIGLVLSDAQEHCVLTFVTLFFAAALFQLFFRAMIKAWNLLAVRKMAATGDSILNGTLKQGREFAAFRTLWAFQPMLYHGSWLTVVVICLYAATKSWWNVPFVLFGQIAGMLLYTVLGEWMWAKTWAHYGAWDKSVYLGDQFLATDMPWRLRLYYRLNRRRDAGARSQGGPLHPHQD